MNQIPRATSSSAGGKWRIAGAGSGMPPGPRVSLRRWAARRRRCVSGGRWVLLTRRRDPSVCAGRAGGRRYRACAGEGSELAERARARPRRAGATRASRARARPPRRVRRRRESGLKGMGGLTATRQTPPMAMIVSGSAGLCRSVTDRTATPTSSQPMLTRRTGAGSQPLHSLAHAWREDLGKLFGGRRGAEELPCGARPTPGDGHHPGGEIGV